MTIAFAFEIFLPTVSGVITVTTSLATELITQGHKVIFIIPRRKDSPLQISDPRIKIYSVPSIPGGFYPGLRIVAPFCNRLTTQYLTQEKVDIVHITGPGSLAYTVICAARHLNIPIVHTWHTMLSDPGYLRIALPTPLLIPLIQKIAKYYYRPFIRNITMTAPGIVPKNFLHSLFPSTQVHLLRNGIDLSRFQNPPPFEALRSKYPAFNKKTFVFVGRMSVEKSVSLLMQIFVTALKKDKDLRLFLIGDGPQYTILRTRAQHIAPSQIICTGALKHAEVLQSGILHHARAFVTASTSEALPMTLIESIASETPIIAFRNLASIDVADTAGIFIEEAQIAPFADAVLRMAQDDTLWNTLKARTKTRQRFFDIRNITKELMDMYAGLTCH